MPYPQITEYQEAVQHPQLAFVDPDLKQGTVAENNLGLPLVMSGGFALTYAVTTARKKCAVRCFHREIPAVQQKYDALARTLRSLPGDTFVDFDFQQSGINVRQNTFPIVRMDWVEGILLACGSTSTSAIGAGSKRLGWISSPSPAFSRRKASHTATSKTAM